MLPSLFPKAHRRFLSSPLLGPIADSFDDWLASNGYTRISRRCAVRRLPYLDKELRRRQIKKVLDLTQLVLNVCWGTLIKKHPHRAGTLRTLGRYLAANRLIADGRPPTATPSASILVEEYANFVREVRGLVALTISHHRYTAWCFLQHLDEEGISVLRGFLRFLATNGRAPDGLDRQIDTPRLYRLEQLPRAIPWETVCALLRSIDRTSRKGLRDYAMFLLIATYGLRVSEVVAITLDDLCWRQGTLPAIRRRLLPVGHPSALRPS